MIIYEEERRVQPVGSSAWFQDLFSVSSNTLLTAHTPDVDTPGSGWTKITDTATATIYNDTTYGDVVASTGIAFVGGYVQGPTGAKTVVTNIGITEWTALRALCYIGVDCPSPQTNRRTGISGRQIGVGTTGSIGINIMEANTVRASATATGASLNVAYEHKVSDDGSLGYTHTIDIGGTPTSCNWTGSTGYGEVCSIVTIGDWAGSSGYGGWWSDFTVYEGVV